MFTFVKTDVGITGSNEDGPTYGDYHRVGVELEDGRRWLHDHVFKAHEGDRVERLVARVDAALAKDGFAALDMDHWFEGDPRYGSPAHSRVGDYHLMDDDDREAAKQNGIILN